jgi:hypothetical protein
VLEELNFCLNSTDEAHLVYKMSPLLLLPSKNHCHYRLLKAQTSKGKILKVWVPCIMLGLLISYINTLLLEVLRMACYS